MIYVGKFIGNQLQTLMPVVRVRMGTADNSRQGSLIAPVVETARRPVSTIVFSLSPCEQAGLRVCKIRR